MSEYRKPLPVPDNDSTPYWAAARERRLVLQRCAACGRHIFYPRTLCPYCQSDRLEWAEARGTGTIYSYAVVHRAPPEFQGDVPYIVALVQLDEGVRLMSNIVQSPRAEVRVDAQVRVVFDDVTPEITLPKFRLVELNGK